MDTKASVCWTLASRKSHVVGTRITRPVTTDHVVLVPMMMVVVDPPGLADLDVAIVKVVSEAAAVVDVEVEVEAVVASESLSGNLATNERKSSFSSFFSWIAILSRMMIQTFHDHVIQNS